VLALIPDLLGALIHLIILGIIVGIFVWLAGRALGAPKATYWHGILIVVSAIIITDILGFFLAGLGWVWTIIEIIIILLLIKHFFAVGWVKAIVIAILAAVIAFVVTVILAAVGLAFAAAALKGLIPGL
jgi:hypothetical protein